MCVDQEHTITERRGAMTSLEHGCLRVEALARLRRFRTDLYRCLPVRGDELFELVDALLCADGPVKTLVGLALTPEHRRGHGALYDGINHGRVEIERLRVAVAALPLPRAADGRLILAVDVSPWLRPDAATCSDRSFCHTYGRGRNAAEMIPGWPYSIIAALEPGRTSWTALLDAERIEPGADVTAVTAAQVRAVVERLVAAGQQPDGAPAILLVFDAGYDVTRLAFLLENLPVQLLGRLRSDRVMRRRTPPRRYATGRTPKHGGEFVFGIPATWGEPDISTCTETSRYGIALAQSWDRLHPKLTHRAAWAGHVGDLPLVEGTVIRLQVEHLPSGGDPKPIWLWWSGLGARDLDVDRLWQAFLRRFDIEHTFRMLKQVLGWTAPRLREAPSADRWTWLVLAAHTQLRLARDLAEDLRRPWEKPVAPGRVTPARIRRGFRNLRAKTGTPARAPKPTGPGPGRPQGSKNRAPATRYEVGRVLATGETYKRPAHHEKGTKPRRTS